MNNEAAKLNLYTEAARDAAQAGDLNAAINYIVAALNEEPSNLEHRIFLANILVQSGKISDAIQVLDVYLRARPSSVDAWVARNAIGTKLPGSSSLELGCGEHLRNNFGASNVYGLDIREDLDKNILTADLATDPLPFPDSFFDVVIAEHVIEHIPRLIYVPNRRYAFIELMSEIWRILKPHGMFYSVTPAYPHPEVFQDPTHVNFITEKTFPAYFCFAVPWAKQYGFCGRFNFTSQIWEGPCLKTVLNKIDLEN